jgi:Family of unknown function (DUF6427)
VTGVFRANNPLNTFLLFVYGILLKLVWFIHPPIPVVQNSDGFLFRDLLTSIKPTLDGAPFLYTFITYFLLFTQAISFNQLINNRRLMQKPNYLPGMSYLLITSFFPEWNVLSAPLLINTLLIWVWAKMSNLYNNKHAKSALFNIGMAIGVCSFFYFPALAFGIMVIFAILITRPPKVAEWLIGLIGVFTPWYFLFVWLFLTNKLYSFSLSGFQISRPLFGQDMMGYIGMAFIIILATAGGFFVQSVSGKQVVQVRKGWSLMFLYLVVALFIPFISINNNFEYWILAVLPVSAFAGCAFFYTRVKWIPLVLHWIMVGFVIYMEYVKK